jgi:hypothetical protein
MVSFWLPSALLFSLLLSLERVSSKYPFDYCVPPAEGVSFFSDR